MNTAILTKPAALTTDGRHRIVSYEPSNSWIKRVDGEGEIIIQAAWADLGRQQMGPNPDSPIVLRKGDTGQVRRVYGTRAITITPHTTPDKADKANHARDWFYATLRETDHLCSLTVVVSHWDLAIAETIARSLKGRYDAIVNGHQINCTVTEAIAVREGFGSWHLMQRAGQLDPGATLLLVLGHGTTEEWLVDDDGEMTGLPSEALAVRHLVDRLANHSTLLDLAALDRSKAGSRGFSPALITAALRNGTSPSGRLALERWEVIRETAVDEWFEELKHHVITTHSDKLQYVSNVVICGGGAALLGDRLQLPFTVPRNPQTSCATGAYLWACATRKP